MTTDYWMYRNHLEEPLAEFSREQPGPINGFARLHKKAVEDGALSGKAKELMPLLLAGRQDDGRGLGG